MKEQKKTAQKNRKKRKIGTGTATVFMIIFVCSVFVLRVYERSCIINLDTEIRALESRYEQSVKYNDDLQAKLLVSGSLNEIEDYAVNKLGMVMPQSSSVAYVNYNRNDPGIVDTAQSDFSLKAWITGLF